MAASRPASWCKAARRAPRSAVATARPTRRSRAALTRCCAFSRLSCHSSRRCRKSWLASRDRPWPHAACRGRSTSAIGGASLHRVERRQPVAVLGIVPALEVGLALFGEGGARFHEVALGAVLVQGVGELLHL